jgi:hypothetical protein
MWWATWWEPSKTIDHGVTGLCKRTTQQANGIRPVSTPAVVPSTTPPIIVLLTTRPLLVCSLQLQCDRAGLRRPGRRS